MTLRTSLGRYCVAFAEWNGWLTNVDEAHVARYLAAGGAPAPPVWKREPIAVSVAYTLPAVVFSELRGTGPPPPIELLAAGQETSTLDDADRKELLAAAREVAARCSELGVDGEVAATRPGPVVTTFEFKPAAGVKYAKIVSLADDLALALNAQSVRIERIPGSSTVGIEVTNRRSQRVTLREIIDTDGFAQSPWRLTLALGVDTHGDPVIVNLANMPHLLVAGEDKAAGLHSMIVSLLYKTPPQQLRLMLIDPKVELEPYENLPHLLHPIISEPKLASSALSWAVATMENRYRMLAECGVRDIDRYNALVTETPGKQPMHSIVIVITELAYLMTVAAKDVEDSLARLAQKARAVGIHLIVATQLPSTDVITGTIKANIPARISYRVPSKIDSRIVLDTQGAEKLLGDGDLLFLGPGTARIRRIHGAHVSQKEIRDVVAFIKANHGPPDYVDVITTWEDVKSLADPLYDEAVRIVLETGQASESHLQRRMKLGYSRAAALIDMMEANGIVGPSEGATPREILVRDDEQGFKSGA